MLKSRYYCFIFLLRIFYRLWLSFCILSYQLRLSLHIILCTYPMSIMFCANIFFQSLALIFSIYYSFLLHRDFKFYIVRFGCLFLWEFFHNLKSHRKLLSQSTDKYSTLFSINTSVTDVCIFNSLMFLRYITGSLVRIREKYILASQLHHSSCLNFFLPYYSLMAASS